MSENHYNIFYYYYVHLNGLVSESVSLLTKTQAGLCLKQQSKGKI